MILPFISPEIHGEMKTLEAFRNQISPFPGLQFFRGEVHAALVRISLSGGWQTPYTLAAALLAPSELLALDKPRNHLDLETTLWLKDYLSKVDKTRMDFSHIDSTSFPRRPMPVETVPNSQQSSHFQDSPQTSVSIQTCGTDFSIRSGEGRLSWCLVVQRSLSAAAHSHA
jgi:hypothetical protein